MAVEVLRQRHCATGAAVNTVVPSRVSLPSSSRPRSRSQARSAEIAADSVLGRKPSEQRLFPPSGTPSPGTANGSQQAMWRRNPVQDAIAQGAAQLAGRSLATKADPLVRRTPSKTISSKLPLTMTSSVPSSGRRQVPEVGRGRSCSVAGKASITHPRMRRDIASLAAGPLAAPSSNTSTCSSSFGDRNEDIGAARRLAAVAPPHGAQDKGCDGMDTDPADKPQRAVHASGAGREQPEEARDAPAAVQPPPQEVQETFEPKKWLCDASISFAFSCLAASGHSVLGGISRKLPAALSLMDPATAFWLAKQQNPEDVEEARNAMKLHELDLVVCPINDSRDLDQADAGLHWTLLVCWRAAGSKADARGSRTPSKTAGPFHHYRYYDSLGCGLTSDPGFQTAQELANRLAGRPVDLFVGSCARQTNFFDCGTYLLLFAEVIVTTFLGLRSGEIPGAGSAPVWEERLASVTPEESDACRAHYHALGRGATAP